MVREVLNQEEMSAIALKYLRLKVKRDCIPMDPEKLRREICNTAKEIGISPEKAMQFTSQILSDAFKEVLIGLNK